MIQGTLESTGLDTNSFDVVLLDSVIEHVASPAALLRNVHCALRNRGVVIVVTPKLNGPSYRLHGADWNGSGTAITPFFSPQRRLGYSCGKQGFVCFVGPAEIGFWMTS